MALIGDDTWSACTASNGKCACGQIWSTRSDAVVAQVIDATDGGSWSTEAVDAHRDLIARAPDLGRALLEARAGLDDWTSAFKQSEARLMQERDEAQADVARLHAIIRNAAEHHVHIYQGLCPMRSKAPAPATPSARRVVRW